jgi:hypothetical protein
MNTIKTQNKSYRAECTRSAHILWALKQLALFVIPCIVLASAGVLLAKRLAPTTIILHAPEDD